MQCERCGQRQATVELTTACVPERQFERACEECALATIAAESQLPLGATVPHQCQRCGERAPAVQVTTGRNDRRSVEHLCEECANALTDGLQPGSESAE